MAPLPTWREKYGCGDKLCGRARVFGRKFCPAHDTPDVVVWRWERDHPDEALPCGRCAHRRIFHTVPTRSFKRGAPIVEIMCGCSIPGCACGAYRPLGG